MGVDDTCFEIEKYPQVSSIVFVDLDEKSKDHFNPRDGADAKSSDSFKVTDKITFCSQWSDIEDGHIFDLVLDNSFYDVLDANIGSVEAVISWEKFTHDQMKPGGVCVVLSMNLTHSQAAVRQAFEKCGYFSVLFANNMFTYKGMGGRVRTRGGIVSLGIGLKDECSSAQVRHVQNFTRLVEAYFLRRQ